MQVALLTVGDELLAGDTENTNASWLATQLTDRGVAVERILAVPDDAAVIEDRVRAYSDAFDAVVVTGGIGGTPDDITMEAVGAAFDRGMVVSEQARADVKSTLDAIDESVPDLDMDIDAEASIPEGSRPLLNEEGLAPGCVLENVYVLPGIPGEMTAMFERVAGEFSGERESAFCYTTEPEANIVGTLNEASDRFGVRVGCYPDREARHNRLKVTGDDGAAVERAVAWLCERIASEDPVAREWDAENEPAGEGTH